MLLERASGILLHPTSLPNGVLDEHAFAFVDWLAAAGQSWWQVLPLGPPEGLTGSPYMSPSAFAGSPGILADPRRARDGGRGRRVPRATRLLARRLGRARRERRRTRCGSSASGKRCARTPASAACASSETCRSTSPTDGADHRAHPGLFQTGAVAGVPPDLFAATGQLWGNPLYDWAAMRADGYRWWIERFRRTFELVDLTRVDHFRGFVSYWAVPAQEPTAEHGRWRRGPGAAVFRAAERELGELAVVAEDLGVITEPVVRLRRELGFPGMAVLQFALGRGPANPHLPENHHEQSVVYTGTHDNDTTRGWWESLSAADRDVVRPRPGRPGVVADRDRLALARGALDRAAPGRARPRQRGAHESARHRGGQLAVALFPGAADRRARAAAARADRLREPRCESELRCRGRVSNPQVPTRDGRF